MKVTKSAAVSTVATLEAVEVAATNVRDVMRLAQVALDSAIDTAVVEAIRERNELCEEAGIDYQEVIKYREERWGKNEDKYASKKITRKIAS